MKGIEDKNKAEKLYKKIKESNIYDKKLKMYKTSESIDAMSMSIGRARAFTPGWLEREAIFMHIEYKYLLALLESGLYNEYYEDIITILTPFLDPQVYGRSTLENSSFISSSVNPDSETHGRGYVARLSGSTAELLHLWMLMMVGLKIFTYENEELVLSLSPILPSWLFNEEGEVSFNFLGEVLVIYDNPQKRNTYGENSANVNEIYLTQINGGKIILKGNKIIGRYAEMVRAGEIT